MSLFGVPGGIAPSISPIPSLHLSSQNHSTQSQSGSTRTNTPTLLDSPTFDPMLPSGGGGRAAHYSRSDSPSLHSATPPLGFAHPDDPPQLNQHHSSGSSRSRGPPNRSQTMDDKFYDGPGSPSAITRGAAPSRNQWGAIGQANSMAYQAVLPARAPALYNQQNHSSPSLALNPNGSPSSIPRSGSPGVGGYSSFSPFDAPDVPPVPSMDDINLGLENMRFEQRRTNPPIAEESRRSVEQQQHRRWDSPSSIGSMPVPAGPDGAMEIRGRGGQTTTSVYSVDSGAQGQQQHWLVGGERRDSGSSHRTYGGGGGGAYGDQKRDSQGVDGYNDESRRSSVGSYLPYDDAYRGDLSQSTSQQQQQQQNYSQQQLFGKPTSSIPSIQQPYGHTPPQPLYDSTSTVAGYFPSVPEHPTQQQQQIPPQFARSNSPHPSSSGYPSSQLSYGSNAPPPPSAYQSQQLPPQPQPSFAPHPQHANASWGYDAYQQAAAQNPYYAAATGQLGLDAASLSAP
ncbi:hypothetical protein JCM5353_003908, partial [Sporobolomyces roseus]